MYVRLTNEARQPGLNYSCIPSLLRRMKVRGPELAAPADECIGNLQTPPDDQEQVITIEGISKRLNPHWDWCKPRSEWGFTRRYQAKNQEETTVVATLRFESVFPYADDEGLQLVLSRLWVVEHLNDSRYQSYQSTMRGLTLPVN